MSARRSMTRRLAPLAAAAAAALTGCADKDLLIPANGTTKLAIQVTIIADQQAGFGPRFLLAIAGVEGQENEDGMILGHRVVPYAPGTRTLQVPIDIAPCLAFFARRGRKSCPLSIGAAIVADTAFLADTTGDEDPFGRAFDYFVRGPFDIAAGGALPTIPPIDLSATRFGVVEWQGDDPARVGGVYTPGNLNSHITGVTGAGGSVTLFATTSGSNWPATLQAGDTIRGPYPQLAILLGGVWKRVTATSINPQSSPTAIFSGVAAISATEAYMGHWSGLFKYDGVGISKIASVNDSIVSVASLVTAGGQKLVLAGTPNGATWLGDGTTFTRRTMPGATQRIDGVCITAPNEAFASSSNGAAYRFDGNTWQVVNTPFTQQKLGLQCPAPGQAFLQAQNQPLMTWNGTAFVAMASAGLNTARPIFWGVVSPTEMYGVSDSAGIDRAFYRFNGQTWTEIGRTRFAANGIPFTQQRMWADPRGGAAYFPSSFSRIDRVTPTGVSVVSFQPGPRDIMMTAPTSAFAVGASGYLSRWDGTKWIMDAPPPRTVATAILHGAWSDGPNNAWAVGTNNTIYRYTGSGWSLVSDAASPVGTSDSYNSVWGIGTDVWAVGNQTILHCRGTSCMNESPGGTGILYSVWGTSANNMYAVGAGGRILRYDGTAWSAVTSPTTRNLGRIRGSGPDDIWVLGDSVLVHYNGTNWRVVPQTGDLKFNMPRVPSGLAGSLFQVGLHVRAPNEVYVGGGGGIVRWDGREWTSMFRGGVFQRRAIAISMGPNGCGFALNELVTDIPGPSMHRGVGPSGCLLQPIPPVTSWP